MTTIDQAIQNTEADILEAFQRFGKQYNVFSDVAHLIEFSPENSDNVQAFFQGLYSMQNAFSALIEATKVIAQIKGVHISDPEKC